MTTSATSVGRMVNTKCSVHTPVQKHLGSEITRKGKSGRVLVYTAWTATNMVCSKCGEVIRSAP